MLDLRFLRGLLRTLNHARSYKIPLFLSGVSLSLLRLSLTPSASISDSGILKSIVPDSVKPLKEQMSLLKEKQCHPHRDEIA